MHELSIAVALVDLACEERQRLGDVHVDALHIRLGQLSGVVKEALAFSFDVAAAGTALEGARLCFDVVPVTIRCSVCDEERAIDTPQDLRCPVCRTPAADLRRGREIELTALEISEEDDNAAHC
jgi:hydrogenase nickel incorporation protein HypA/HybF